MDGPVPNPRLEPRNEIGDDWVTALAEAVRGKPAGLTLFYEDRADLVVTCDTRDGLDSVCTRQRGLTARRPLPDGSEAFLAGPAPRDARRIVAAVLDSRPRMPSGADGDGADDGENEALREAAGLDARAAGALITGLESDLRRLSPNAHVRARWVGVNQAVAVARSGLPPAFDGRRGARIRLTARQVRDDRWAEAVAEAVLPEDSGRWAEAVSGLPVRVAHRLDSRLRAKAPRPGETPVVFASGVAGVLIHELVGHALEGDQVQRGSWLARCPEGVLPRDLSVVEDPRRGRIPWRVDDEGEPARPVPLLRDGRVRTWLVDQRTAAALGRRPTGHGRRASFREPVRPRMGCTFLAAGGLDPQEVLDGTGGVFVHRMESASADPASGTAVFRVTDADLIEHGRPVGALLPHLLRVRGVSTLSTIDRLGHDLTFDACVGTCQRHAQTLAVSVGAPTIRSGMATVVF